MRAMTLETANAIVNAAQRLPTGSSLIVHECSWDDYEQVLEGLVENRGLRIDYDAGRLAIVSPKREHGRHDALLKDLVLIFCEVFGLNYEGFVNTTWTRKALLKGVQPDESFYIKNARQVIGRHLDTEFEPPPDLVIEVDITSGSLRKLPIFAALGIKEVWRYDGKVCRFYVLVEDGYAASETSECLLRLPAKMVTDALAISKTEGQGEARKAFRRMLKTLRA